MQIVFHADYNCNQCRVTTDSFYLSSAVYIYSYVIYLDMVDHREKTGEKYAILHYFQRKKKNLYQYLWNKKDMEKKKTQLDPNNDHNTSVYRLRESARVRLSLHNSNEGSNRYD